jgi:hypothetical protein
MRSLPGKSRLKALARIGLLAVVVSLLSAYREGGVLGQSQSPPTVFPPTASQSSGRAPFGTEPDAPPDPMLRRAQEEAAKKRNIERQNKLTSNSERIVQLAGELNAGVAPAGKGPKSAAALSKKAEEIEKLARSVRDLMRSE